jgi:hypothetical protein
MYNFESNRATYSQNYRKRTMLFLVINYFRENYAGTFQLQIINVLEEKQHYAYTP